MHRCVKRHDPEARVDGPHPVSRPIRPIHQGNTVLNGQEELKPTLFDPDETRLLEKTGDSLILRIQHSGRLSRSPDSVPPAASPSVSASRGRSPSSAPARRPAGGS